MRQNILLIAAMTVAFSLTGCQSGSTEAENEALRRQVEQLEQKISDLEQQMTAQTGAEAAGTSQAPDPAASAADKDMEGTDPASALTTTRSLEELADVVTAYEEKVNAAAPSGNASEDMEQFMDLKQEEKTIDQDLDLHEDELEYLYRNGSLSREEYKSLERELERLEDRLDAAEDLLEYTFGMDD